VINLPRFQKIFQGDNMKLAKLSLAAMVVAGLATSSFAADTLADAFKKGKVSGELKAWYFDRDTGARSADIVNVGMTLGYVTDSYMGFSIGATFQSNSAPFVDADGKNMFKGDMWGSGAVLSEAYVAYTMKNTTAKVGRMYLATPLVASSGSRFIKQSFEGAVIINSDLPATTLVAGYVDKFQNRTDGLGNVAEFAQVGTDGAYTLLAINKSIPGLTLTGQWAQIVDSVDLYYIAAEYAGKAASFTYGLAGQYQVTSPDSAASDGGYYGLKASLGMGAFNAYVAYSKVDKDAATYGLGGGADIIYTGNVIAGGNYGADAEAYAIDANYVVMPGFKVGARYSSVDLIPANSDQSIIDLYADYAFEGALKGFALQLQYEDLNKDGTGADTNELRFRANYKF
jgi:hypothetical protein